MPTHDENEPKLRLWEEPQSHGPEEIDVAAGYERQDVGVPGIVVFLVSLAVFVVVSATLCWGIGKVINAQLNKEDGPNNRWTKTADIRQLGNLPNNPEMQNKVAEVTQSFPTPRLQTDDGNQEIADMHAREDLLLEHYSWVDQTQNSPRRVRIPIERAMDLIVAQNRLQVAPSASSAPLLTGDSKPEVALPLTNGFARTGYEQEEEQAEVVADQRKQ